MTNFDWSAALAPTAPLDKNMLYASRQLPDGRWLCVQPLTYQRAMLGITAAAGETVGLALELGLGYADLWDYASREAAIAAMEEWSGLGEPRGWIRHLRSR